MKKGSGPLHQSLLPLNHRIHRNQDHSPIHPSLPPPSRYACALLHRRHQPRHYHHVLMLHYLSIPIQNYCLQDHIFDCFALDGGTHSHLRGKWPSLPQEALRRWGGFSCASTLLTSEPTEKFDLST
jgi:hypothetical protein